MHKRNETGRSAILSVPAMKNRYDLEYPRYQPDEVLIEQLKTLLVKKTIIIVMGTWCGDSQVQVSRFYKIIDTLDFPAEQIELICVDETKNNGHGLTDGLHITRIPVFIFEENQLELGRITESPLTTLENDMVEILKK